MQHLDAVVAFSVLTLSASLPGQQRATVVVALIQAVEAVPVLAEVLDQHVLLCDACLSVFHAEAAFVAAVALLAEVELEAAVAPDGHQVVVQAPRWAHLSSHQPSPSE